MSLGRTWGGEAVLLKLEDVDVYYGPLQALRNINIEIEEGEIVCLLGGNASGKSTTMKSVLGLLKPARGTITFQGQCLNGVPTSERVHRGISPVPEARRLFGSLTVRENLELGAYTRRDRKAIAEDFERVLTLFPRCRERLGQLAGTLSGGEQQMVAMARALMARPTLLCMDEPSMGLAPTFVDAVFDLIQAINRQGTTIFVIEQNANVALSIANRGYVLQAGEIVLSGEAKELLTNPLIRKAYLGEF